MRFYKRQREGGKRSSRTDGRRERLNEACVKGSRVDLGPTNIRWLVGCRCCACRPSALPLVVSFLLWVHGHVCYVRTLRLAKKPRRQAESSEPNQWRQKWIKLSIRSRFKARAHIFCSFVWLYCPGLKLQLYFLPREYVYSALLRDCTCIHRFMD